MNGLAECIDNLGKIVPVETEHAGGTAFDVTVTWRGQSFTFRFDQGNTTPPTPVSALSALWARTTIIRRKDERNFYEFISSKDVVTQEDFEKYRGSYGKVYQQWKDCATWAEGAFGSWFGIDPTRSPLGE